jgi:hypothetical protein
MPPPYSRSVPWLPSLTRLFSNNEEPLVDLSPEEQAQADEIDRRRLLTKMGYDPDTVDRASLPDDVKKLLGEEPTDDSLRADELRFTGRGSWSGLLFDNAHIGLEPRLTWGFTFEFEEVKRDDESSAVSLTVEWVPLPGANWSSMAGQSASSDVFAEPIECSAYFFEHYRYDSVQLRVLEQSGSRLRVAVEARGDIDELGVPEWNVEGWLDFACVYVQLDGVTALEDAAARLAEFTDASGLVPVGNGHNIRFVPPDAS